MRTTNAISYDCLRPSSINETIHAGQIWFTLLMLYFMIALNQNSYRWSHKARYTNWMGYIVLFLRYIRVGGRSYQPSIQTGNNTLMKIIITP